MSENESASGSLPAEGPLTREGVQAEVLRSMQDPSHPQHQAHSRGLRTWNEWAQAQYARIPGATNLVEITSEGITIGPPPPPAEASPPSMPVGRDQPIGAGPPQEGSERAARVQAALVEQHGAEAGAANVIEAARQTGAWLFQGEAGAALRGVLDGALEGLAPNATVRADVELASFLADLALIRHEAAKEPPVDPAAPMDFTARLDEALFDEFGVATSSIRRNIDETLAHLFHGAEGEAALRAITRALDSLPPAARVRAYTLSARHLAGLVRLRQSQT